ncbi:hypothetical protein ENKNEFLB_02113 [Nocardioides aquaticus]|uniref:Uncharacterized protein n=1 Tax=Nocardioides aquaticus TaxID=160826 RepID=A0ABX8EGU3_9ACTN|nr:hypothetical protein [Nocardioides aquaticus]QVT79723.1 hypothetical protein ENKNEFLB_02113 [Nocardioides aquaticus]
MTNDQATLRVSVSTDDDGTVRWHAQLLVDHDALELRRPWIHEPLFIRAENAPEVIASMVELTAKLGTMSPENLQLFEKLRMQQLAMHPLVTANAILAADGPVSA